MFIAFSNAATFGDGGSAIGPVFVARAALQSSQSQQSSSSDCAFGYSVEKDKGF